MIVYFANRGMDILGHAATALPEGFVITEDLKSEDVETGVASFECKIGFTKENRSAAESMAQAGNYLLRSNGGENEFYTIIDSEIDTKDQTVYVYAEDAGLDLLNEIAGPFTANEAHTAEWYVNKYIDDSGFEIGINEIPESSTRVLSWEGEATCTERLASIATQFDGFEVSYSFDVQGMKVTHKYVNIYEKRGKDIGEQLRLNREIDRIIIKKSVVNLATALYCTGGTLDGQDNPIDLTGYEYDDGDFYIDGDKLKSRNALAKWSRYQWEKKPTKSDGHIVRTYSYDTTSQQTLCAHAVTELKKVCDMEVNYELEITELPENIKIGDRINIVDDAGELYLSSRLLKLEVSIADNRKTATLGEYLIRNSGISQKVQDLADQFEETHKKVEDATQKVNSAEKDLESAQQAAKDAQTAADEAQAKADEAAQAAANAKAEAANAAAQVQIAEGKAETAIQKAETAQGTAEQASVQAADAKSTADAAKLDAAAAEKDIASLGDRLTTVTTTMEADYARKTDLTEATAHLQTQISQNAAEISSTATKVQTIDETANNAAEQAEQAQTTAATAQRQADQAIADAEAAQTAAANAAAAATNAQTEADTAKAAAADAQTAADTAKTKADQAQTDLDAAKANLTEVSSKVDATEAEVAAAQQAVVDAQAAADRAATDAEAAQTAADAAKADATKAQTVADNAKTAADNAQAAADQAQADADAAQAAVDALAVRVTTAETKITQNAEKIELAATKTEVADMLGGYSTKEEIEAAISVESDVIKQTVSRTYATKTELEDSKQYTHVKYSNDGKTFTGNRLSTDFSDWRQGSYGTGSTATAGEEQNANLSSWQYLSMTDVIPVSEGQKWFEKTGMANIYALRIRYDANGAFISSGYVMASANGTYYTIPSGVAYVRIALYAASASGVSTEDAWREAFENGSLVPEFRNTAEVPGAEPGTYLGTLVDSSKEGSEVFSDYTWSTYNVDDELEEIRQTIVEQSTSLTNTCEQIVMEATEKYVEKTTFEEYKEETSSQFAIQSDEMSMKFTETQETIESVNGELQTTKEEWNKYFRFSIDGLEIGEEGNELTLKLDNDRIAFVKNGVVIAYWDGNMLRTGNLYVEVNERAQFGDFAYVPRTDGTLMFLKVGGE